MTELGVEIRIGHGFIDAIAPAGGLRAAHVVLDFPSVGATENLLMAAIVAHGTTVIENAAREPEIVDLVDFLNGDGRPYQRRRHLHASLSRASRSCSPVEHRVVGDRIEAGTFLVAGAIAGGPVTVTRFRPAHLDLVLAKLEQAGCIDPRLADGVTVRARAARPCLSTSRRCRTRVSPPTCRRSSWRSWRIADGNSIITENVFENRFMFADELAPHGRRHPDRGPSRAGQGRARSSRARR